jgi:Flp pilus assembly protein TadB
MPARSSRIAMMSSNLPQEKEAALHSRERQATKPPSFNSANREMKAGLDGSLPRLIPRSVSFLAFALLLLGVYLFAMLSGSKK